MGETFKVGDICILRNDPALTKDKSLNQYDGEEVEIVEGLNLFSFEDGTAYFAYRIRAPGGLDLYAAPHELRRPKPPTTGEESVLAQFKGVPQAVPA